MAFKLVFITDSYPSENSYVINNEKKLSGLEFLNTASSLLRKVINPNVRQIHTTFTNRQYYCMEIPSEIAIESGKYEKTNVCYVRVPDSWLNQYVFYSAKHTTARSSSRQYPYSIACQCNNNAIEIISHIDELEVISKWAELGYPNQIDETSSGTTGSDNKDSENEKPSGDNTGNENEGVLDVPPTGEDVNSGTDDTEQLGQES